MPVDFSRRSYQPELMDAPDVPDEVTRQALRELRSVNMFLGGYRTTLSALAPLLTPRAEPWTLLDVGTGAGDIPEQAALWARRRNIPVRIVAVDREPTATRVAAQRLARFPEIRVVRADVFALPFAPQSFDVVMCALFLHHFPESASEVLRRMFSLCRTAVVVNDLHRHPLAYYGFQFVGRVLRASPMVRHDGPLSVLRGFTRRDWKQLAAEAGLPHMEARRRLPFRWQVTFRRVPPNFGTPPP